MAIERVSLINSNFTTLVSDSDYSKYEVWLTDGQGGVMFSNLSTKPDFALTGTTNPDIAAGNAIIVATRATSTPIVNQKVALRYELSATKSFSGAVNGSKIFIRVNQTLINDPTLIEDTSPSTDFALGRNIGVMEMAGSYPSDPYIALWEYDGAVWTDVREMPVINGNKVDMGALTQNIVTTGNIQGDDITASGDVTGDRLFQDTYKSPTVDNELAPKLYVDGQILSASSVEALVDKDTYFLGEDADAGDSVFVEDMVTYAEADQVQAIGDTADNTRVSIPAFGSGTASNTLKLALRKYVSPSVNLGVRIETDNAGEPSGTLVDANATATVTEASLTTSLVDTTVTLAGSITIPLGTKVHIVLFAGTYGSETINGTNYFGVGFAIKNTTTRQPLVFDGTNWVSSQQGSVLTLSEITSVPGTSGSYFLYNHSFTITPLSRIIITRLRFNGSSAIIKGQTITSDQVISIVLEAGITYTLSVTKSTNTNGATYTSPLNSSNFTNTAATINRGGPSNGNTIVAFEMDSYDWFDGSDSFFYTDSDLFTPKLLSKTDATYSYKLPVDVPRVLTESKSAGENAIATTLGLNDNFTGLTPNVPMYLADTPGTISSTPGTNMYGIGKAIDENNLYVYDVPFSIPAQSGSAPDNNELTIEIGIGTATKVFFGITLWSRTNTSPNTGPSGGLLGYFELGTSGIKYKALNTYGINNSDLAARTEFAAINFNTSNYVTTPFQQITNGTNYVSLNAVYKEGSQMIIKIELVSSLHPNTNEYRITPIEIIR